MPILSVPLSEPLKSYAEDRAAREGFAGAGALIESMLAEARERDAELERLLQEGLNGDPIEVNATFWADIRAEAVAGILGNISACPEISCSQKKSPPLLCASVSLC